MNWDAKYWLGVCLCVYLIAAVTISSKLKPYANSPLKHREAKYSVNLQLLFLLTTIIFYQIPWEESPLSEK